eukprot:comp20747_c1_seq1/m.27178 comp20747_c1_seq1/g.27178  ORF comp20747_c1_seq1/g.27178 comp20747_c1_seq1/m.27178 type:complete len:219 (-) comp20747_c1_seq1:336-992(-)
MFSSFTKPFAAASERNKEPILEVLRELLTSEYDGCTVLEVGSGTGQHVVHFAPNFPKLTWQPTDLAENMPGLVAWIVDAEHPNIKDPAVLDAGNDNHWLQLKGQPYDVIYTANTSHIMPWNSVLSLFRHVRGGALRRAKAGDRPGLFIMYGPFNDNGQFTSEGNKTLDTHIKGINPLSGLRDMQAVLAAAKEEGGLAFVKDIKMPANNHTLVFLAQDD